MATEWGPGTELAVNEQIIRAGTVEHATAEFADRYPRLNVQQIRMKVMAYRQLSNASRDDEATTVLRELTHLGLSEGMPLLPPPRRRPWWRRLFRWWRR